jgi:drug/metabolite transporter (DMT)-like permease
MGPMKSHPAVLILVFVLLGFFWGGSFIAIKETVTTLPSWFSAALRLWVATAAIYLMFRFAMKQKLSLPKGTHLRIWISGLVTLGIPFAFLFWGERYVSAGIAGMINGSVPLFTALILCLPFRFVGSRRSIDAKTVFGLGLGFVGVASIFAPLVEAPNSMAVWGAFACIAMSICYALGNILNQRNFSELTDLNLYASVFHQHLASLIFLSLGSLWFDGLPRFDVLFDSPRLILGILYLGIFSTALALSLYFFLIKRWGSVRTSAVAYIIPVFTLLLDALIFKNIPSTAGLIGIILILAGIFFIRSERPKRTREQSSAPQTREQKAA